MSGKKRDDAGSTPGFGGTLGDLLRARGLAPSAPAAPEPPAAPAPASPTLAACDKVVVRRERKGHGGKTVTRVEGLAPLGAAVDDLAKRLKKALGCGATVEDGAVLVQGDQVDRVAEWLQREGARRVVRG
jgi:translation initiation factor 1